METTPEINGKALFEGFAKQLTEMLKKNESTLIEDEIKYPIEVKGIAAINPKIHEHISKCGEWIAIRPCDPKYENKTFLGIYMGEFPIDQIRTYNTENQIVAILLKRNPAIYVPDLKTVIYGIESWWSPIKSPDGLRTITDQDINNTWYVKALKELVDKEASDAGKS